MKRLLFAALLAAGLSVQPAHAAVVTFTPIAAEGYAQVADGYQEGGLSFSSSVPGYMFTWGKNDAFNPDKGGATLSLATVNVSLVVTAADGGLFDLAGFDLTTGFNGAGGAVPFTWTDAGGLHASTLALDDLKGLQTFSLNLKGLSQFTLRSTAPKMFQVDNIVASPVVSAVPEPATWAMMILGFGLAGSALRRARAQGAAA